MRSERCAARRAKRAIRVLSGSSRKRAQFFSSSGLGGLCCRRSSCRLFCLRLLDRPLARRRRIGRAASAFSRLRSASSSLLLPLRKFRFPSRKEALDRIDRVSGLASRPAAVIDDRLGNGGERSQQPGPYGTCIASRAEQAVALLRTGGPSPRMVDLDRYALRASVLVALIATGFVAGPEKYARARGGFRLALRCLAWQRATGSMPGSIRPPIPAKPPLVLNLGGNRTFTGSSKPADESKLRVARSSSFMRPAGTLDMDIKGALVEVAKDKATPARRRLAASGSAASKRRGAKPERLRRNPAGPARRRNADPWPFRHAARRVRYSCHLGPAAVDRADRRA